MRSLHATNDAYTPDEVGDNGLSTIIAAPQIALLTVRTVVHDASVAQTAKQSSRKLVDQPCCNTVSSKNFELHDFFDSLHYAELKLLAADAVVSGKAEVLSAKHAGDPGLNDSAIRTNDLHPALTQSTALTRQCTALRSI